MHTRDWSTFGLVIDGVKDRARNTHDHALAIPPRLDGHVGLWLRQTRFCMLYRSMIEWRYVERLVRTESRAEAHAIMVRVVPLLEPPWWMWCSIFSSSLGAFALMLLARAQARYDAAVKLREEFSLE